MGRPLQHRRRIKMALVAGLALDVGLALVTTGVASAAPTSVPRTSDSTAATAKANGFATLKIVKPNVSVRRKGKSAFTAAHDGQKLHVGDTIQTDTGGEAEIDYTESSFTRLDVSTTFTLKHLTDNQGHRQVEGSLDSGRTWNRTSALTESESFSQDGAGATASVVGSAFVAECDTSGHCTFTSVVDGLKLVTVDGEAKLLDPLQVCDSTEVDPNNANLCGVPTQVSADVLAANAWIMSNLFLDGIAGFPGPTITGTIVVNNGVVTFTPTPPAADNPPADNPPATAPPTVDPVHPLTVTSQDGPYPDYSATPTGPSSGLVVGDEFKDTKFTINGLTGTGASIAWVYFTAMHSDPTNAAHTGIVCAPIGGPSTGAHCGDGLPSGATLGNLGAVDYAPVVLNTQYPASSQFSFLAFEYENSSTPKVDQAAFTVKVEDNVGQQSTPQDVQVTVTEAVGN